MRVAERLRLMPRHMRRKHTESESNERCNEADADMLRNADKGIADPTHEHQRNRRSSQTMPVALDPRKERQRGGNE